MKKRKRKRQPANIHTDGDGDPLFGFTLEQLKHVPRVHVPAAVRREINEQLDKEAAEFVDHMVPVLKKYFADPEVIKVIGVEDSGDDNADGEDDEFRLFDAEEVLPKKRKRPAASATNTLGISALRKRGQWPFRQNDQEWRNEPMWVQEKVAAVHQQYNGASLAAAQGLLHRYPEGNTIGHEGCLTTSLAMVLRLLGPASKGWTPRTLNQEAQKRLFYTEAGLSMVPLYADLVADVTNGEVQLCAQEQYFSGERGWANTKTFPPGSTLLRGYRALPAHERGDFVVMLKIGTHDDTFASHYVVVDPNQPGSPDEKDVALLDPVQPLRRRVKPWMLSDSCRLLNRGDIGREWRRNGISALQLSGVWVFGRWRHREQHSLAAVLFQSIVRQDEIL